ncbi:MAG: hypothetical protein AAFW75_15130 [Cyanobacteria bacterium J06636_16]
MNALQQVLEDLRAHRQRLEASGPIAPLGVWIEVYCPGGRDVYYARLKAEKATWGKAHSRGLKRAGSADHRNWQNRIQRRDALLEIEQRWRSHSRGVSQAIQAMLNAPIWEP